MDFHRVYPDLAAAHRVPLVPFMLTGVLGNRDLMSADGIHPNASGARAIAETVLPHVRAMIEPPAVSH
jgi:acyl-CoA thioesterase-1